MDILEQKREEIQTKLIEEIHLNLEKKLVEWCHSNMEKYKEKFEFYLLEFMVMLKNNNPSGFRELIENEFLDKVIFGLTQRFTKKN